MPFKVLWCDRNYDYVDSFIAATKNIIPEIEFVLKDDPVEAVKEIVSNSKSYQLIISGQVFKTMNGTEFFEIVFKNKLNIPFLLLTAQIDSFQFVNYDIWSNFTYIDKLKKDYYFIAEMIKDLVNRDISSTYLLHEKLKRARVILKLSPAEMAKKMRVAESEVLANESDYKKVTAHYVLLLADLLNQEVSFLVQSSLNHFEEKIIKDSKDNINEIFG